MKTLLRWLKRVVIFVLLLVAVGLALAGYVRYQGVQYTVALLGGGYARSLSEALDAHRANAAVCSSGPIKVVTYNIFNGAAFVEDLAERFADGDIQGFKPWSQRVAEIRERIAEYDADLIGLQEMGWNADLANVVPPEAGYTLHSYKAGSFEFGDSALLFRTERFEMLDGGQLWLGPTPDLPMAFGFKRLSVLRYSNWALLKEKSTGFKFVFVNTHFDNASVNKEPASRLFRERITNLTRQIPMIVTGDFNSPGETDRYKVFAGMDMTPPLLPNAQSLAETKLVLGEHGATPRPIAADEEALNYLKRIDHILAGGPCPVAVKSWLIDTRPLKDGDRISDHDLIAAEIEFGKISVVPPVTP